MNYLVMPSQAAKRPRARICVVHLPTLAQLVVQDLVVLRQPELALGAVVAAMRVPTGRAANLTRCLTLPWAPVSLHGAVLWTVLALEHRVQKRVIVPVLASQSQHQRG